MESNHSLGLIGLGTMGRNLALNIAENGFEIAVYTRTASTLDSFLSDNQKFAGKLIGARSLEEFVQNMQRPRKIILMVPAGTVIDDQIKQLSALIDENDIIIDAGNSQFEDTKRRADIAAHAHYSFMGIGVSGGEYGARFGPSIMAGGEIAGWEEVEPILEAISARHEDQPCVAWMGSGGAGHFVKMVHNGLEYADMQMIAEVYGVLRDGMKKSAPEISQIFSRWNQGPLQSYLLEISAEVTKTIDPKSEAYLIDMILDRAGQKGTGRWTVIEAQNLASPVSVMEAAVLARNISARLEERHQGEAIFGPAPWKIEDTTGLVEDFHSALIIGRIANYSQGFSMLEDASKLYDWDLPLPEIAKVWRQGCIIRSAMLDKMAIALAETRQSSLMFSTQFSDQMLANSDSCRRAIVRGLADGHPLPCLSAALIYYDMLRTKRSTANMIQAQRDYFGAHTFERTDERGSFNGPWNLQSG